MQMNPSDPAYAPAPAPRIGEWLSEAWDLFKQQWQVYVVQSLISLVISSIIISIMYVVFFGAMMASVMASERNSGAAMGGMLLVYAMAFAMGAVIQVLMMVLYAGMERTAAKQLRGEPIAVGDMFSAFDVAGNLILAGILMSIASMIGALACYIGAFVVMGALVFVLPLVVQGRLSAVEAMQRSWETTRPHLLMYILWAFLVSLIASLGVYVCGVGLLVTMPIAMIAQMVAYRDVVGLPGALPGRAAAAGVPQYAPPPVNYGPAGPPVVGGQCPACGRPVAAGAVRCPACGAALTGASPMAAPPPPPAPPAPGAASPEAPPARSAFTAPPTAPSTVPPGPGSAEPSPPLSTPGPSPAPGGAPTYPAAGIPAPPPPGTSTSPAVPPDVAPGVPPASFGTPPPPAAPPGSGTLGSAAPQASPPPGAMPPAEPGTERTGETGWQPVERPATEPPPAEEPGSNPPAS